MLEPILCGLLPQAPLLPKLRGHFAEFLDNASSVGLRILSSSTCVGLRYGHTPNNSGFSRHTRRLLRYSFFRSTSRLWLSRTVFPSRGLLRLCRSSHSRLKSCVCVPTVLLASGTGISTCCPSATSFDLALGPDLPSADQLYAGNLRYSAERILTFLSLLIPAFSLLIPPPSLSGLASPALRMLLYHSLRESTASVSCFSPGHFRRRTSRLVSCYALFECVAASEPTS